MSLRLPLACPPALGHADTQADFVTGDVAALAAHMQRCALSNSRMSAVRAGLQTAHSVAAGRIVTLACLAVVFSFGLITLL